ncbi:dicarboxylate/amino acid:cation symporter [Acidicapsa dinghuensis]|uniref:Dicarboxylate/amino acid:cation symporter n=1 Tax=Acidicapsa dinghuensis TaxID=2218256 RepID=A0ABW1EKB9_9BACT|nr:dicarboxylate/amino acid:cation symporter [Acidicapsa dinghuensis]
MRETGAGKASSRGWLLAAVIGLLVYGAGVLLAGNPAVGMALRVAAVLLLLVVTARRRSLTAWTFFAMLAGAEVGVDWPAVGLHLHALAEIFLRLVRLIVAPLIIGTMTTGIVGHGELKSLGRLALKTLIYFEVVTTLALLVGVVAIDLSRAGEGVNAPVVAAQQSVGGVGTPQAHQGVEEFLVHIFPENLVTAVGENQILQVAVFSILLGVSLAQIAEDKRAPLMRVLESMTAAMFQMTKIIMYMAPLAAGAALAFSVASMGVSSLLPLAKLVATFYVAAVAMVLLVFVPIMLIARVPVGKFFAAASEPAAIGFATSASQSALPIAMERMEEFGVPRWVVSFVIPSGYTFNMDGASLYLSVGSIFAAQAAGMHLTAWQQAVMVLTLMLTSKGIAGVPRATLMILLATAGQFHLPSGPIWMLLGVDALIDMGRTALNVTGNCLAAAVVGRGESGRMEADTILESH